MSSFQIFNLNVLVNSNQKKTSEDNRQGEDFRTVQINGKDKDLRTSEDNSQGEDLRTSKENRGREIPNVSNEVW